MKKLKKIISAAKVKYSMQNMNLLMIGHTPEGFGFGRALDLDMAKYFDRYEYFKINGELTMVPGLKIERRNNDKKYF